ncbi:MAG: Holliday junction resolvase RuvX [Candidatus Komeilibacteria bacterium]|nr:Holliday junction resolvase RuvX [Candidatus Komeilibacteria bacterium]
MKYLGVDYGLSKIGMALADDDLRLAVPLQIIHETERAKQLEKVLTVVQTEEVDRIIVGRPYDSQGKTTSQTAITDKFIAALKKQSVPVILLDERFTTAVAKRQVERGRDDDAIAAMHILQNYLDQMDL